ncbi:Abc transporter [Globisporangium polare]
MRVLSLLAFTSALLVGQSAAGSYGASKVTEETKTLDQLYQDAINEGGSITVYHGGDTPTQANQLKNLFNAVFPKINMTLIVDYSKYHDVRVDNQLETNSLVPDVVALQTLQDFPRWADEGKLLNYKPANFSQIYDGFKDANGAWFGYRVLAFSYATNATALGSLPAPASPLEIVDPKYKGLIASSYPNDDDAALFIFVSYVEKYGWDWAAKLATQNVSFNRGSHIASQLTSAGQKGVGMATSSSPAAAIAGKYPFLAWAQRMAILKKAKHPAAAKLLISWIATEDAQRKFGGSGWTIRKDLPTTNGYSQIWEIPEAGMSKFAAFMEDREKVEAWKATFSLYFGEVHGEPTPGVLGLHPGA